MLRVSATQGSVAMFVTNRYAPGRGPVAKLPSPTTYIWAAPTAGPFAGLVYVPFDDPNVTVCLRDPTAGCAGLYVLAIVGE